MKPFNSIFAWLFASKIWLYFQDNKDWNLINSLFPYDMPVIWLYFQDNKDWNYIIHPSISFVYRSDCISKITRIETLLCYLFTNKIHWSDCISKITRIETWSGSVIHPASKRSDCISKITRIETAGELNQAKKLEVIWLYFQDNKDWNNKGIMFPLASFVWSDCISKITRIETLTGTFIMAGYGRLIWLYFQDNKDWNLI